MIQYAQYFYQITWNLQTRLFGNIKTLENIKMWFKTIDVTSFFIFIRLVTIHKLKFIFLSTSWPRVEFHFWFTAFSRVHYVGTRILWKKGWMDWGEGDERSNHLGLRPIRPIVPLSWVLNLETKSIDYSILVLSSSLLKHTCTLNPIAEFFQKVTFNSYHTSRRLKSLRENWCSNQLTSNFVSSN